MRLKEDLFGTVERIGRADGACVVRRDTRTARGGLRWLARRLATREARALRHLAGVDGVPALLDATRDVLERGWIAGEPMQHARPRDPAYYREALRLLRSLHSRNLVHNDLAKEPNWLVTPDGRPALVDFQLAGVWRRRTRLFRMLAHDDLRHLLKHKRTYLPTHLTARERRILATPSAISRLWRGTGKRLYRFVTRRLLGWADREGAGDRTL
jgi:RIO-like serine/threonine protein kinase